MIDIKALLKLAVERNASDLHLKAGAFPTLRVQSELLPLISHSIITRQDTLDLAHQLLNTRQKETLAEKSELDLSFGGQELGRFRLAIFHQRGTISLVFRVIPDKVPSLEELHLPAVLKKIADERRGLILVTGATGSGKSTTLSAMLQYINTTRRAHIITIEDPIEFALKDELALITQREISVDTLSFSAALRSALRQDPDVIMVGEMRDQETVVTAMQAAETGHLVMSTLHTSDATETVSRIITMFSSRQQSDIRFRFAGSLKAIVSMRLIKSSSSGHLIPAVEVLRNTELIRTLIEQPDRNKEIRRALEAGSSQYQMQSFDQSLLRHLREQLITVRDALSHASAPEDLRLRIDGIISSAESM